MDKQNKQAVNYRYPEQCCGWCSHLYQNTYGDMQCSQLEAGNTVDVGGLCDLFHRDVEEHTNG